jgi:hypothetical protein
MVEGFSIITVRANAGRSARVRTVLVVIRLGGCTAAEAARTTGGSPAVDVRNAGDTLASGGNAGATTRGGAVPFVATVVVGRAAGGIAVSPPVAPQTRRANRSPAGTTITRERTAAGVAAGPSRRRSIAGGAPPASVRRLTISRLETERIARCVIAGAAVNACRMRLRVMAIVGAAVSAGGL